MREEKRKKKKNTNEICWKLSAPPYRTTRMPAGCMPLITVCSVNKATQLCTTSHPPEGETNNCKTKKRRKTKTKEINFTDSNGEVTHRGAANLRRER